MSATEAKTNYKPTMLFYAGDLAGSPVLYGAPIRMEKILGGDRGHDCYHFKGFEPRPEIPNNLELLTSVKKKKKI